MATVENLTSWILAASVGMAAPDLFEGIQRSFVSIGCAMTYAVAASNNFYGEHSEGGQRPPTSFPLPPLGLEARRLFRLPPCREGTIHLQTSMSSQGFEPIPYGTVVSVANHYTGWVTVSYLNTGIGHMTCCAR
ncbi:hypothetical protein TNCV_3707861 [Trichonephila clavipes]|nr:hypothetical protein TNCV_3707861 [Trichonephila clavipes]